MHFTIPIKNDLTAFLEYKIIYEIYLAECTKYEKPVQVSYFVNFFRLTDCSS